MMSIIVLNMFDDWAYICATSGWDQSKPAIIENPDYLAGLAEYIEIQEDDKWKLAEDVTELARERGDLALRGQRKQAGDPRGRAGDSEQAS